MMEQREFGNVIEQHIHDSTVKIMSCLSEECRHELKNLPREITAGIHCAALHCALRIVTFAGSALGAESAEENATKPYPEQIRHLKDAIDAFNSAMEALNTTIAPVKESVGVQRKKWARKEPAGPSGPAKPATAISTMTGAIEPFRQTEG